VFISSLCSESAVERNLMTSSLLKITVLPILLMHKKIMTYLVEVDTPTQGMRKNIWDRIFLGETKALTSHGQAFPSK